MSAQGNARACFRYRISYGSNWSTTLSSPGYAVVEAQQVLNQELSQLGFKVAILVPNSRLAYLARLQFGDESHRVFYNDMAAAALWPGS